MFTLSGAMDLWHRKMMLYCELRLVIVKLKNLMSIFSLCVRDKLWCHHKAISAIRQELLTPCQTTDRRISLTKRKRKMKNGGEKEKCSKNKEAFYTKRLGHMVGRRSHCIDLHNHA